MVEQLEATNIDWFPVNRAKSLDKIMEAEDDDIPAWAQSMRGAIVQQVGGHITESIEQMQSQIQALTEEVAMLKERDG